MEKIIQKENKILRLDAEIVPADKIQTPKFQQIIKKMHETLADQEDGVALAAPQIGESWQIFVVAPKVFEIENAKKQENKKINPKLSAEQDPKASLGQSHNLVYINPEIIKTSQKKDWIEEGCLSVKDYYGKVKRFNKTSIRAYGEKGQLFTRGGSGLMAQIFQHEIDHLNGILFTDKAKDVAKIEDKDNHNE